MPICRRCFISGKVQGVAYRAATQRKAIELGVSGYARNLGDGRVEVLCCGDAASVDTMCAWLWQGPPHARVSDVTWLDVDVEQPSDFFVR